MQETSRLAGLIAALLLTPAALAQSFCASDGQPRPSALLERFVSADCVACWSARDTPGDRPGTVAIDWIVPGAQGDDAPLSAVAAREALQRLDGLHRAAPAGADSRISPVAGARLPLRVAHGLAFNGYMGASIEVKPARTGRWTAWLVMVETIPAGVEGTPVARNLVRNALQLDWSQARPDVPPNARAGAAPLSTQAQRFFESRPMGIPPGAVPERLRMVGWVEDAQGRIRAIAQSACAPQPAGG